MDIGIFTECYKPIINGVVVSVDSFREEMQSRGHRVYLFTPDYMPYLDDAIIPLVSLPLPTRTQYRCATPFMRRRPPLRLDIVHAHCPFSTGLLAFMTAHRYGCPLVFTYHTRLEEYAHYVPFHPEIGRKAMVASSRMYSNLTDLVIAPSVEIATLLRGYGVHRRIEVLPTGVALDGAEAADGELMRKHYGIPAHRRILLNVGRLAREKNLEFLLESFKSIHAAHPETLLMLVGDGPHRNRLESLIERLGISQDVILTGMIPRDEIAHYYAGADLFVFTSLTETQGLVIGESLRIGTPVAAIAAGGVAEVLRSTPGSVTCPPSQEEFTTMVCSLLSDEPRYAELKQQALSTAPTTSAEAGDRLIEYYRQVIDRTQRTASLRQQWRGRVLRRLMFRWYRGLGRSHTSVARSTVAARTGSAGDKQA